MDELFLIQKALRTHGIRTHGMVLDVMQMANKLRKLDRMMGVVRMGCKKKKGGKK